MNLPEIVSSSPDAPVTDRRAVFFIVSAVVCGLLAPVCPAEYRWVGWMLTGGYVLLALASWLDHRARRRITV